MFLLVFFVTMDVLIKAEEEEDMYICPKHDQSIHTMKCLQEKLRTIKNMEARKRGR